MKFMLTFSIKPEAKALTRFSLMWSGVMELRLIPVLEDAELGEVLTG